MNENQAVASLPKQGWWQDRAIIVGIIGVVATIVVGVVTYWLTAGTVSREYQERIKAARNDTLTAVSRSIGEGKVPSKAKIQAVISSVERKYGIKQEDAEKPETVIDDIIERVLANEFLDAPRREELSTKLLAVRDEQNPVSTENQPKQSPSEGSKNPITWEFAVVSAAITSFSTILVAWRLLARRSGMELHRILIPILIPAITVTAALLFVRLFVTTQLGAELLKALQKR